MPPPAAVAGHLPARHFRRRPRGVGPAGQPTVEPGEAGVIELRRKPRQARRQLEVGVGEHEQPTLVPGTSVVVDHPLGEQIAPAADAQDGHIGAVDGGDVDVLGLPVRIVGRVGVGLGLVGGGPLGHRGERSRALLRDGQAPRDERPTPEHGGADPALVPDLVERALPADDGGDGHEVGRVGGRRPVAVDPAVALAGLADLPRREGLGPQPFDQVDVVALFLRRERRPRPG